MNFAQLLHPRVSPPPPPGFCRVGGPCLLFVVVLIIESHPVWAPPCRVLSTYKEVASCVRTPSCLGDQIALGYGALAFI